MSKSTNKPQWPTQLQELVDAGYEVVFELTGVPFTYEITVYGQGGGLNHSHYGGNSLAEAVNKAFKQTIESDVKRILPPH